MAEARGLTARFDKLEGNDSCSLTIDADTLHSIHTPDRTSPAFLQMSVFLVVLRQPAGFAFPIVSLIPFPRSALHHLLQMSPILF